VVEIFGFRRKTAEEKAHNRAVQLEQAQQKVKYHKKKTKEDKILREAKRINYQNSPMGKAQNMINQAGKHMINQAGKLMAPPKQMKKKNTNSGLWGGGFA